MPSKIKPVILGMVFIVALFVVSGCQQTCSGCNDFESGTPFEPGQQVIVQLPNGTQSLQAADENGCVIIKSSDCSNTRFSGVGTELL